VIAYYGETLPLSNSAIVRGSAAIQGLRDVRGAVYLSGHGPSGQLNPRAGEDPVKRFIRWVLRETRPGVRRGLSGPDLGAFVGERFAERVRRVGWIRIGRSWIGRRRSIAFPVGGFGFLEDSVAAAERDVRGADS
jgi:hypothetical protein